MIPYYLKNWKIIFSIGILIVLAVIIFVSLIQPSIKKSEKPVTIPAVEETEKQAIIPPTEEAEKPATTPPIVKEKELLLEHNLDEILQGIEALEELGLE